MQENTAKITEIIPVLPLRGLTVFPGMNVHFDVGREKSAKALHAAMGRGQRILLVTQKEMTEDDPNISDLYTFGTIAHVEQVLKFPTGENIRVLVKGETRAIIEGVIRTSPYLEAEISRAPTMNVRESRLKQEALVRSTHELFQEYSDLAPRMTQDVVLGVLSRTELGDLADYIAQNLSTPYQNKQSILEEIHPFRRLAMTNKLLNRELEILRLETDIAGQVREQIDKNQRDYFLREQLRAIQNELGEGEEVVSEQEEYRKKIASLELPAEAEEKLLREVARLTKMQPTSPESTVIRNYLDACLDLPWNIRTKDKSGLVGARKVLDRDHYGMDRVKERIIEFIAARQLAPDIKGQIICLVGPPGVGKTSIGKSVAEALGRKFARLSLGGVRDEADIRGHRKTYIGAMPGRIMNALKLAGSKNALLLLDEIDKMSSDFRGDPTAALLEVLDSEQNHSFRDHYIELPFDLSEVMFITTANTTSTIPAPLLDRMEVIELSSYTTEEKFNITKKHLLPKQMKRHGLDKNNFRMEDAAVYKAIECYTREAGVRTLEREIGTICRRAAKKIVAGEESKVVVKASNLVDFLGVIKYRTERNSKMDEPGVVNGLAWTSVGGELLEVEVSVVEGTGKIEITGNLGTVMNESAKAALTYVRSRADVFDIDRDFYKKSDIHIHFPEGAIPKDGPSAGITIATALVSALTGIPANSLIAMTGEISIRGRVLPIGGLKEKSMAAYRAGIKKVIIPQDNLKDLEEIDAVVREKIEFVSVTHADDVIAHAIDIKKLTEKAEDEKKHLLPINGGKKNKSVRIRQ
ncbi:MAG: endopeptidase La [Clostridia bacterium]|nr:endopeptidase La [Clostridia bacterium]